jgi:hypothetical protein
MVMIESLACGTPVLAMNCGSVSEVLCHGVSGLIGNSVDELVGLASRVADLDRRACRREAERHFSSNIMADGYEQVYQRVIADYQEEQQAITLGMSPGRLTISTASSYGRDTQITSARSAASSNG